jgi:predicted RNase H-like HicB family nuclease
MATKSKSKRKVKSYYNAVVEKCADTGYYVGYVPGFSGCHSQGKTIDELRKNLQQVLHMLLEDGKPSISSEFIGVQTLVA